MVKLDKEQQIVTLKNGQQIHYDALITTTPLDITLSWLGKKDWAERLNHRYVQGILKFIISTRTCAIPNQAIVLI